MSVEESLRAFDRDTDLVCRTLGYTLAIRERANGDAATLEKLQKNGLFWTDYEQLALTTIIISLGRIFDVQKQAHSVQRLQEELRSDLRYFDKNSLAARKKAYSSNTDWLDDYMKSVHELNASDLDSIAKEIGRAESLWKKCKPMRDRVLAHDQAQAKDARTKIFTSVTYEDIIGVAQALTNVGNALFQAEVNGRQPQFGQDTNMVAFRVGREAANAILEQLA
ncbi:MULTISPECIES: hypothetical protein [Mesorhizobium]|uniref:HEPN AbiU2-like domain-containing protein n=1 Tax=Rhizobium loti TaxID=381 RepID=A0A6M7U2Z0_RHILI|nr:MULTISPECIES: hypothetical protein [Mesorhizobium]KRB22759.1 hypothetical protein ASE05_16400 [Mesorhizobium sp. Root172]OBQ61977.1 hypothetical protein A8145_20005 [Mesorhizobium loti]QKC71030.1 hypothetical protein EB815_19235 [Mesorhizobium loti]